MDRHKNNLVRFQQEQMAREAGSTDRDKDWDKDLDTEAAAELAPISTPVFREHTAVEEDVDRAYYADEDRTSTGAVWGWAAFAVSIISLFMWPALLGSAGAVLGVVAFMQGYKTLGSWSIGIGLLSLVVSFFLAPL